MTRSLDPAVSKQGKEIVESDALHPDMAAELAKVAEVSVQKGYKPFNWLDPESTTRVSTFLKAGARHRRLAKLGYNINKETKLSGEEINIQVNHLVYAAYNDLMAALIIKHLPEHDDRMFVEGKLKK